ncbi:MAG: mechanosensitive ion channel [Saprospiraceae bacterium]|nr:mechanosensitive ion channel [Saprospiraceae bacterium]
MANKPSIIAIIFCFLLASSACYREKHDISPSTEGMFKHSDAEMLMRSQRLSEEDHARLNDFKDRVLLLNSALDRATRRFDSLDLVIDSLRAQGLPVDSRLTIRWEDTRDEVDFLLRGRQYVERLVLVLERKQRKQEETIRFILYGETSADSIQSATASGSPPSNEKTPPPAAEKRPDSLAQTALSKENDWRLTQALRMLEQRRRELQTAWKKVNLVEEILNINQEDLALTLAILGVERENLNRYDEIRKRLEKQRDSLLLADTVPQNRETVERRIAMVMQKFSLQSELLQKDSAIAVALQKRIEKIRQAWEPVTEGYEKAERVEETARFRVEFLQGPLSPFRFRRWLLVSAPRLIIILGLLGLFWWGARRLAKYWLEKNTPEGTVQERMERSRTLYAASKSGITVVTATIGLFILLSELQVDLSVVLGSAAIVSLIVAFAAQNLVRDFFSGFMILLENQYRLGNVVSINNITGTVEQVSMRMTTLRDIEGVVHYLPHGQINSVSNLTHDWSQVNLKIGVAYKEQVDQVMEVLLSVALGMRADPKFGPFIIEDPVMLGVDDLADSAVVIRMLVKTRPQQQWPVKREMLRRIKNRFDELGIEIPFPHRTVYMRHD